MKNKINIIGIIGEEQYKNIVIDILISKGFYKISINDKIKSVAKSLSMDNNINDIRERGYKINRLYWINLVLSSIDDKQKHILIDDIRLEDMISGIMKVYYICSNEDNMPKNINPIYKNKNLEDFKNEVNKKFIALKAVN